MRIAFWNIKNTLPASHVILLVDSQLPDLLIFAEADLILDELEALLIKKRYKMLFSAVQKLLFFTTLDESFFSNMAEISHMSIVKYSPPVGDSLIVAGVHLPSKLYMDSDDQQSFSQRISEKIEEFESINMTSNTIVIGDFNMNPFEKGMVAHRALNSTFFSSIAREGGKTHNGVEKEYFYNPSLALYNDERDAKGSYFRKMNKETEFYWYLFDQVLIRPSLIPRFNKDTFEVLSELCGVSLLNKNGKPKSKVSDHLPIVCELLN